MRGLLLLALVVPACHSHAASRQLLPIGSPCQSDEQCGSGGFACAADHPAGYCVAACRRDPDCPSQSVCVGASDLAEGACHRACSSAADCRSGYVCDSADASHGYCDAPGPRPLLRRIRSRAWR
jgi:hypothetical protein